MRRKNRLLTLAVPLTAVLTLAAARPCSAQLVPIDLGVRAGQDNSHALAMNNSGQVVGYCANRVWDSMEGYYAEDGTTYMPFVWQNGTMTPLPLLKGFSAGSAEAINSSGQIVGECWSPESTQACLWDRTKRGWTVTGLGVPAGCTRSRARMINDAGQIIVQGEIDVWPWSREYIRDSQGNEALLQDPAGNYLYSSQMNGTGQIVAHVSSTWGAALWNAGIVTDLVPEVYDAWINDAGQVVGTFVDSSSGTAVDTDFIYLLEAAYGLPAGLNTWPVSTKGGYFGGINNAGQVLSIPRPEPVSDGADDFTTDVKVIQMGGSVVYQVTVPGSTSFQRVEMNGKGQVVGNFSTADGEEIFFFADPVTGLTLLGGLGGPDWRPEGLTDSGMIFGASELADGTVHACVWNEVVPFAPLEVLEATAVRKAGTVTVSVSIKNTATTAADTVMVDNVTLGDKVSSTSMPVNLRTIRAGATKQFSLKYASAEVPSGMYTLSVSGTSSLGGFAGTQTVEVP